MARDAERGKFWTAPSPASARLVSNSDSLLGRSAGLWHFSLRSRSGERLMRLSSNQFQNTVISKIGVVELSGQNQQIALDDYSRLVVRVFILDQ